MVALLRSGDAGAFEALFDRYRAPILSFCRHMLGSAEDAEDALQQCFISAYNGIVGDERDIRLRPWLYAIARNQCLSQLRARREHSSIDDVEPSVEGLSAEVQRRADLREMLGDIARLPEDQRAALVLAELGDLTHDDIARVVECPKDKVKALVFQARSSLSASRQARDTSCVEIREQLATLTGGALRRTTLRRHVRECDGCRAFYEDVKRQRAAMAILLPVVPTAGLKAGVLSSVGLTAAGGGAGIGAGGGVLAGGGIAAAAASSAAKVAAVVAVAAVGVGGTVAAVRTVESERPASPTVSPAPSQSSPAGRQAARVSLIGGIHPVGLSTAPAPTPAAGTAARARKARGVANGRTRKTQRGRSGTAPGRLGTAPGRAKARPGRSGTAPGRSGALPGRSRATPPQARSRGRAKAVPGRTRSRIRRVEGAARVRE